MPVRTWFRWLIPGAIAALGFGLYLLLHPGPLPRSAPRPCTLRVAMLLPGRSDDGGWNSSAYHGLSRIERDLRAEADCRQDVAPACAEDVFREYANDKYDLVFGVGGEFAAAAESVARDYPRTVFVIVGHHPGNQQNLGAVGFREGELGYLAGAAAALKTKSGKVAFLGGQPLGHVAAEARAYEDGARAIRPGIVLATAYAGGWGAAEQGAATARAAELIAAGHDVILVNADLAGRPVHALAQSRGVFTIGWSVDEYEHAPGAVLTSGVRRLDMLLLAAAQDVKDQRWRGRLHRFGLEERAHGLAPFRGALSPEAEQRVEELRRQLVAGEVRPLPGDRGRP